MSKADFFLELHGRLRCLPLQEQQRIIGVYEDLFRQAEANGKSEQEIIASLGHAPACRWTGYGPDGFPSTAESGFRMFAASLALVLFNAIFVLGPAVVFAAVLLSMTLAALVLLLGPVWIFTAAGTIPVHHPLTLKLFVSMACTGLGLLLATGLWVIHRACFRFTKTYIRMNIRLIKGE